MPATKKAKLRYCFLVNRSFKRIRANMIVTRQYDDVIGAVSIGLIATAKVNAIVPKVSQVAAPQQ